MEDESNGLFEGFGIGVRVELLKEVIITKPENMGFIKNHAGELKKKPPSKILKGTCGTIEHKDVMPNGAGYSYIVFFCIPMSSDEFACARITAYSEEIRIPYASIHYIEDYPHLKTRREKGL